MEVESEPYSDAILHDIYYNPDNNSFRAVNRAGHHEITQIW